jgi:hypothetical protein
MLGAAAPPGRAGTFPARPLPSPTPPPVAATGNVALDAFLPEAEAFVEKHRGLAYSHAVDVTLLADADFQQKVVDDVRHDAADYATEGKVLKALGLIAKDVDVEKEEEVLLGGSVIGFYDPKKKALVVRAGELNLAAKDVLIHELTHALQDQAFDIGDATGRPDDESGFAFTALVEGDAVTIEREWASSLAASDRATLRSQQAAMAGGGDLGGVPDALVDIEAFPYIAGPVFRAALVTAGGQRQLDAAFKERRPTTTAQVIHPSLYLAGTGAAAVDLPAADGPQIDKGALGELGFDLLLQPIVVAGQARAAAAAWAGDRYVAWSTTDGACVRDELKARDASGLASLRDALDRLAAQRTGMSVTTTADVLTLTACG